MMTSEHLRPGVDRDVIIRDGDFDRLSLAVRALFDAWQQLVDEQELVDVNAITMEQDEAMYAERCQRCEDIAAFEPQSVHDAASLLECVFLDYDTESAWGVFSDYQERILANVKAFLRQHTAEAGANA